MTLEVTAPGKLVLIGEYSVLFGAPALVVAVGRRARVAIEASPSDRWTFSAPGLVDEAMELEFEPEGGMRWSDPEGAQSFGLVDALLEGLVASAVINPVQMRPVAATLDTRSFFQRRDGARRKLGLGSSAALTTALANALVAWSGDGCPAPSSEWLETLVAVHREMQGGRGSGIDVAASLLGGAVRYRLDPKGGVGEAAPVTLPADLRMTFIWTGRSASTGDFLERLEECRMRDPQIIDAALDRLGSLSERGIEALGRSETAVFLEVVDHFGDALESLGKAIGMSILSDEHRRLRELAARCGHHYKPSGAGGGDFGVACSRTDQSVAEFVDRVEQIGFEVVDLDVDPIGMAERRS